MNHSRLSLLLLLAPIPTLAANYLDLNAYQPTRIQDAYTLDQGKIELLGTVGFEHQPGNRGDERYSLVPQAQIGLTPRLQLSLAAPYRMGDAYETDQGDVDLQALYNLTREEGMMPAISVGAGLNEPYGSDSGGTEASVSFVTSKTLGPFEPHYRSPRVHLNLSWFHNLDRESDEREGRYFIGAGYSQPVIDKWMAVFAVSREQERNEDLSSNIAELGVRHQLSPSTALSMGASTGLNDDAADWGLMFGVQHSLR